MTEREQIIKDIMAQYNSAVPPEGQADRFYMEAALELARAAASFGEVPVGCVIFRDGAILSADFNGREETKDAVYHAECSAISKACRLLGGWRLTRCTMYVTLEPCPMCAGAIWNARVPRVVIGAKDAKAGALGSLINLNAYPLNHKPELCFGIMAKESTELLQEFFTARRCRKNTKKEHSHG